MLDSRNKPPICLKRHDKNSTHRWISEQCSSFGKVKPSNLKYNRPKAMVQALSGWYWISSRPAKALANNAVLTDSVLTMIRLVLDQSAVHEFEKPNLRSSDAFGKGQASRTEFSKIGCRMDLPDRESTLGAWTVRDGALQDGRRWLDYIKLDTGGCRVPSAQSQAYSPPFHPFVQDYIPFWELWHRAWTS